MPLRLLLLLSLSLCAVGGCALPRTLACPDRMTAGTSEWLYFGTASPRGPVTPEQWTQFIDEVVTPQFPQGLSVWQAAGQWQGEDGGVIREDAYVLNVVHSGGSAAGQAFATIVDAYKLRFQQQAVLRVSSRACVGL